MLSRTQLADPAVVALGDRAAGSSWSRCRRPRRSCHGVRHRLAVQRGEEVVDGELGHLLARGMRRRADVGNDDADSARSAASSSAGSGSGSVTSRAAPAIVPSRSAVGQRDLVDDRPAGGVDEDRRRLHLRQRRGVDQVAGLRSQRAVQRDEVRALEQLVKRDAAAGASARAPPSRSPSPGARPPRRSARADDPERGAVDVVAEVRSRLPRHPLAGGDRRGGLGQVARRRQQQRKGQVGGRVGEHVGRVADGDPALGGGLDVDVVVADGVVGDRRQARRRRPSARRRRGR